MEKVYKRVDGVTKMFVPAKVAEVHDAVVRDGATVAVVVAGKHIFCFVLDTAVAVGTDVMVEPSHSGRNYGTDRIFSLNYQEIK